MKKNLLIIFLISVIIGLGISCNHNKYDLNRDGRVDEKDLTMMEKYCGKE